MDFFDYKKFLLNKLPQEVVDTLCGKFKLFFITVFVITIGIFLTEG